jgi:leucyl-tRNA---protein transferase
LQPLWVLAGNESVVQRLKSDAFPAELGGTADQPAGLRRQLSGQFSGLGWQWLYFEGERLMGVALMDEVPGAISLVYAFYAPEWRPRSLGTYSILKQLEYAKARNVRYADLGYWVGACPSSSYKRRFRPREILREYPPDNSAPVWEDVD